MKLEITVNDYLKIQDFATRKFQDGPIIPEKGRDLQTFLFLHGLYDYLCSKGITPNFTITPVRTINDTTPLDDL